MQLMASPLISKSCCHDDVNFTTLAERAITSGNCSTLHSRLCIAYSCIQGLPLKQLSIVFQALVISRIQYAVSAWGGFILAVWKRKIDVFLLRAYRFGFCGDISFDSLLFSADQTLFKSLRNIDHCLHPMLPEVKAYHYNLRDRGHDLVLPMYRTSLFKKSYLIRHLFETV
jgi:hypothetical protein